METVFKDEAIVLRKSLVGSVDLSITVYTKQVGKENIYISKGQIIKSTVITATEPFNWIKGVFRYVKGKLYLQEIDRYRNLSLPISQDIKKFETAFYINRVFNKYVIFPDEKFYILLKKTFYYLSEGYSPEYIKLNFLSKLVYLSGIYPELDTCQICKAKVSLRNIGTVSVERTGVICSKCFGKRNGYGFYSSLKGLKSVSFQNLEKLKLKKGDIESLIRFFEEYLSKNT